MEQSIRLALLIILIFGGLSFAATSIDSCQNLTSAGGTYQLTKDINGSGFGACIDIQANDITLDCQNYQIQGTGNIYSQGVYNNGYDNVKVKNCQISQFENGIHFESGAGDGEITWNTIQNNTYAGILLEYNCSGTTITDNTVSNNGGGIVVVYGGSNSIIQRNTANGNSDSGIYLDRSINCLIEDNEANGNAFGIYLDPLSDYNQIMGNTADSNEVGFVIFSSSSNQISNNYARMNSETGASIEWGSTGNQLSNNDFSSNADYGVFFQENGSNNELAGNTIIGNYVDIHFDSGCTGNSGANTCDTIEDYDGGNSLTCSGSGTGGQTGTGTGNQSGSGSQTGGSGTGNGTPEETNGFLCCPLAFIGFAVIFLFVRKDF